LQISNNLCYIIISKNSWYSNIAHLYNIYLFLVDILYYLKLFIIIKYIIFIFVIVLFTVVIIGLLIVSW